MAGDTTIVFENTADTLLRPFHFYTEEYAAFQANDSSDYQVIYVTEPVYDSPYMLHYSLDKHVGRITQKHNTYIQERKLYAAENNPVRLKIDNLKKGSYFVFHDSPAFHTTGSFLMIKKKGTIVYSCQTYLVTLVNAEKQDARFKEVAGLIDILTKYK